MDRSAPSAQTEATADARLRGRRVLITGAASGIGRELATLSIDSGAETTLIDLDAGGLAELDRVGPCDRVAMDVSDPAAWSALPEPVSAWDFVALNAGETLWHF